REAQVEERVDEQRLAGVRHEPRVAPAPGAFRLEPRPGAVRDLVQAPGVGEVPRARHRSSSRGAEPITRPGPRRAAGGYAAERMASPARILRSPVAAAVGLVAVVQLATCLRLETGAFWVIDNAAKLLQVQAIEASGGRDFSLHLAGRDIDPELR